MTGHTITEKIIAAHCAGAADVRAGAIVTARPDVVLLNDVSGPLAFTQFDAMGAARPFDPRAHRAGGRPFRAGAGHHGGGLHRHDAGFRPQASHPAFL